MYRASGGDVYEGEWRRGDRWGEGSYRAACGTGYIGQWRAGKRDGRGTFRCVDLGIHLGVYLNVYLGSSDAQVCGRRCI